ncbi:hypothetical protein [Ideonella livida]|uniref:Uncharacterized protein n=1 Tax=Ideonella livida TaxID=2707176 RepID=A0A7C9PKR0_9BURK|nr:hypothetical protein [Ideonella livida]NDY93670.1 hypothetical protein [Ideonella livida]
MPALRPKRLDWARRKSVEAARLQDRDSAGGAFRIRAEELPALGLPPPRPRAVPASTDLPLQGLGLRDKRPRLYWQGLDRLERCGLRRNPWRDAGRCRPAERR